ncbi:hypothetical protein ONA92_26995 [Mycobacteroides salmoniphilum]|uniref:hypothetical protein n=1 Tax=Mycobacteroides salmoniphilum TaxID=404941 RepID=UPI003561C9CB
MLDQILVSPAAVSGSAGFDASAAGELGAGAVSSAPVISTVLSPGMDPTSLLVQALAIQRAAVTLMTLAQFSGQRAFYGAAKEWSSASFSAIEGINTAAAMI